MRNIDFSDIHKFIVSIGLALMIFALLIPWLFFREKFDLLLHAKDLDKLTEVSKNLITYRQEMLLITAKILPYLSVGLFLLGLFLVIAGLIKWNKKQKVIDEHQKILLNKTKVEIEVMSVNEKLHSVKQELAMETVDETNNSGVMESSKNREITTLKYIEMENLILEKVKLRYSNNYDVKSNLKIGNRGYDIIMSSNYKKDIILDIKYYRYAASLKPLKRVIEKVKVSLIEYAAVIKQDTTTKIIVILPSAEHEKAIKDNDLMMLISECEFQIILLNEDSLDTLGDDFLSLDK